MNQQKNNLALVFGGRSGEHAVSLRSSRSVRSVLDLDKYNVFEIGITLDGVWLSGENALSAFENGDTSSLQEVSLLSTDGKVGLYQREYEKLKLIAELDVIFPVLMEHSEKMALCRACWTWRELLMLAQVCLVLHWAWTRGFSRM